MKIAIVEDDINMRKSLEQVLKSKAYQIVAYKNPKEALKHIDSSIDMIITDINMPQMNGIEFLKALDNNQHNHYDTIVITAHASLQYAIEALRLGAKDFITKPFDMPVLIDAIERVNKLNSTLKTHVNKPKMGKKEGRNTDFIAPSPALQQVLKMVDKVATTKANILLLGESGVGKEVFANYIHKLYTSHHNVPKAPFVPVNMAALPETLLESELFGYEKGAFTDAKEAKAGKFEQANGGTLFLDEIGEMPIHLQAKLLRAIQEKEIHRLGSSKGIKVEVRILSATNVSLPEKIKKGEFREDLFYRLNTVPIDIPPLRERQEEIMPIAEHILQQTITEYELSKRSFSKEAREKLLSYAWYGNIRELIAIITRAALISEQEEISEQDLGLQGREL